MSISREEKNGITPDLLKEYFEYRDDGNLIWIKKSGHRVIVGNIAKAHIASGYLRCNFFSNRYLIHRLIWIYHNGTIPVGIQIDHIDRDRLNNRIENLRLASRTENMMNNVKNTSGYPGVCWRNVQKKWRAQIQVNMTVIQLGSYNTLEEAIQARRQAELKYGLEVREEFHIAI